MTKVKGKLEGDNAMIKAHKARPERTGRMTKVKAKLEGDNENDKSSQAENRLDHR